MRRIYVASSWKNDYQPRFVQELRKRGHKVYDFRNPMGRKDSDVWESVTPRVGNFEQYKRISEVSADDFAKMLEDRDALERFRDHYIALQAADTCILLLPCGKSAHVEAGLMAGFDKEVFVLSTESLVKPELMYLSFGFGSEVFFTDEEKLFKALEKPVPGVCRVCGCSMNNPCSHPDHGNCYWVEPSLCSHCASKEEGGLGIKDDPLTKHCINDKLNVFQ